VARYERGEPNEGDEYCYELVRRAIADVNPDALEAVVTQYRGLVLGYVRRHPWIPAGSDDHDWVIRTFERFWKAVGPDRFGQFPDIGSVLAYLKMCVHSVVSSELRSRLANRVLPIEEAADQASEADEVERPVLDSLASRDLWAAVSAELQNDAERIVADLSFVQDMKPAEIHARFPEHFPTTADVYRIKRNLLDRLRRSPRLRDFLG
jgi:RNA polymerase sigma factor (sigma-70 family)